MRDLTPKQKKFVDAYNGDIKAASKEAGTSYTYGRELLTKTHIKQAIRDRENKELSPTIASRQKRQQFWTVVMEDGDETMPNRLRAAELLGKSEADFTEKIQQDTTVTVTRKTYGT